jgi:hypothetical protein
MKRWRAGIFLSQWRREARCRPFRQRYWPPHGRSLPHLYAKQRLGIETDHEAQIFGQGLTLHVWRWLMSNVMRADEMLL